MKVITPTVKHTLLHNFLGGVAWGLGVTIGFAIVGFFLSNVVNSIGGIPAVGGFFANLVRATLEELNGF